jgi:type VI secretion system protein ImpE
MNAEDAIKNEDPQLALSALQQQVRAEPSDPKLRVFLFQLLSVLGQWERAATQLKVCGELDAGALAMVNTYASALQAEAVRHQVFAGKRQPLLLGKPQRWVALLLEALRLAADGHVDQSQSLRNDAFEQAPAVPGRLDDVPFTWLADADPHLGPVLELIFNGGYYWVPMELIRSINLDEPSDLRDLVWAPAQIVWANGGDAVALIPARYAGTDRSEEPKLLFAKETRWTDLGNDLYQGVGQRMLATDNGERGLLQIRRIEFDVPDVAEAVAESGS